MTERQKQLAFIIISTQLLLTLILLWLQRDSGVACKIATICYVFLCFIEIFMICHWYRDKNQKDCKLLLSAYRLKRHDVYNSLQILHTMAQLGKKEQAIKYICSISDSEDSIDNVCRLRHTETQSFLLELFFYFRQRHINVIIEAPEEFSIPYRCIKLLWRRMEKYASNLQKTEGSRDIKLVFEPTQVEISTEIGGERLALN